jgi:hypothetical protein
VEYGEEMGVEYGETPPQRSGMRPPIAENSLPTGGFACFLALYWGGIPRKEVGQRESNPGVECGEKPLFCGWNVEKKVRMRILAYQLFTFSVFHFFSEIGSLPSVSNWMRTNKPFCQPAALYPTAVGENAGQLFHDGSYATRPMSVPSSPRTAPIACRQLIVIRIYADERLLACSAKTLLQSRLEVSTAILH